MNFKTAAFLRIASIIVLPLFLLLALSLKSNAPYGSSKCEELLFKSFKGFPMEAHDFKKNCTNVPIKYSHEICQSALQDAIVGIPLTQLKSKYGSKIGSCFSNKERKKYLNN